MRHNVKHKLICFVHSSATNGSKVAYRAVYIVVDNTLYRSNIFVLNGQHGAQHGRANTR